MNIITIIGVPASEVKSDTVAVSIDASKEKGGAQSLLPLPHPPPLPHPHPLHLPHLLCPLAPARVPPPLQPPLHQLFPPLLRIRNPFCLILIRVAFLSLQPDNNPPTHSNLLIHPNHQSALLVCRIPPKGQRIRSTAMGRVVAEEEAESRRVKLLNYDSCERSGTSSMLYAKMIPFELPLLALRR